ncbi:MAG: DUF975 family protein [Clostridiaceae bacterium]
MWSRYMIKEKAKEVLRLYYWKAFLVSLVIVLVGGSHNGGSSGGNTTIKENYNDMQGIMPENIYKVLGIIIAFAVTIVLLLVIYRIFIGYVVEVGGRKFFTESAKGNSDVGYLGYGFGNGRYFDVVATMFMRSLYTFLWTLLLIIPGIVKSYAYRMVPYILADNPNIGYKRAIELSNEMTDGQKFDIFVLDLSFIGWYLLGIIAFGVGILFVKPYDDATNAELYLVLRQDAIDKGITNPMELNLEINEHFI